MKSKKLKQVLSLFLAAIMLFTMVPMGVFAAEESYAVMEAYNAASSADYHKYYSSVYSVTFLDYVDTTGALHTWDVSQAKDGSVTAWMKLNQETTTAAGGAERYDVYIGASGGVGANPNSSYIFYCFSALSEVNGLENFKTGNATTFSRMFEKCYNLKKVDMSSWDTSNVTNLSYMFTECNSLVSANVFGWDTSNVTTMAYMFNNCHVLEEVDFSTFNTSNVTNMNRLFFNAHVITKIYVGSGWDISNVTNGDSAFNCCYALMGGKDEYDNSKTNISFATTGSNGFMTPESEKPQPEVKTYTVTYEFVGDVIPETVTAPTEATYDAGTTVTVEANPTADGYIFSGWSTEDADITDNQFTVNNDIRITGTWFKLYNVYYAYDPDYTDYDNFPVDAPDLTTYTASYKAGEPVEIKPPLSDSGRFVFVGWDDREVSTTGDGTIFIMPEKDVTLYGYFKIPVEEVVIEDEIILNVGEENSITLDVHINPDDATITDIVYESSHPEIAEVDESGKITPKSEGTTTITVYSKDDPSKSDTVTVTVKYPVTSVEADKETIDLNKGETDEIKVTVNPSGATNKVVTYTSSNPDVAIVDENGKVTAIGDGEAIITVTSKDDLTKTDTVKVNVRTPVTSITAEKKEYTLDIDETDMINVTVNPSDATNTEVYYESSNPEVVKVLSDGEIVAVGKGTATITITSKDNSEITETVTVTVRKPADGIVTDKTEYTVDLGETVKIEADVTPDDASDKELTYKSEDETIAKVSPDGTVTPVNKGTTTITITGPDGTKETVTVTVKQPADGIVTDKTEYTVDLGKTVKIEADVTPDDASDKELTYKSEDETIAKVSPDGTITPINKGTTTITITGPDGTKETVTVTVRKPADDIVTDKTEYTVDLGKTVKIEADVTPDDASDKKLTYKSEDETIAKISPDGTVTPVNKGTTTITITGPDGTKETVTVTVKQPAEGIVIPEENKDITLNAGDEKEIDAKVSPENSDYGLTYESSNPNIAEVTEDGKIIAKNEGKTNITVKSEDGKAEETITVTVKIPVKDITATEDFTLDIGETKNVDASANDDATNKELTYKSSDETVATVDKDGNVTAVGKGTATITITSKDNSKITETVIVTVRKPAIGIVTDKSEYTVDLGKTVKIEADVTPDDASDKKLTYKSEDETIAKVSPDGTVTPVNKGTTTITITGPDGTKKTITVTVRKPADDIVTDKTEYTVDLGKTVKIEADVTPDDASDKKLTYKSADETIAKVSPDGTVTPVNKGTTTITITGPDGTKKTVTVIVNVPEKPEDPEAPEEPDYTIIVPSLVEIKKGDSRKLEITIEPTDSNIHIVSYTSEDPSIATIDAEGNITGVAKGETNIKVVFSNGEIRYVPVHIIADSNKSHYIVFGKTEKIGWYNISKDGGETWQIVFGNSNLVVPQGTELIIKAVDIMGDPFTFYINGKAHTPDENGYVYVVVEEFMLIGALGIPVIAPDAEESLTWIQQIIKSIKEFFEKIFSLFKK